MLHWRKRERRWQPLGKGLENLPLGFIAGETYIEQSVQLEPGDMVLAFSDGVTEVEAPEGEQLSPEGFLDLVVGTHAQLRDAVPLNNLSKALFDGITRYHGPSEFEDDLTLLAIRRSS
jgi:phosphoserine phosphatase RsbU/P